jgi:hypothetical protein
MFIQIPSKIDKNQRTAVIWRHQSQAGDANSVGSGCRSIGATASRITRNLSDYINDLQVRQSLDAEDFFPQPG